MWPKNATCVSAILHLGSLTQIVFSHFQLLAMLLCIATKNDNIVEITQTHSVS